MSELNILEIPAQPQPKPALAAVVVPDSIREPLERLEVLLERLVKSRPRPAPDRAWNQFFTLAPELQAQIVKSWRDQAAFIEGALDAGLDAFDEVGMLRYAVGRLGLLAESSLFSTVEPDDVFEILGPDYVQVYRSFSYFSLCNYSLLELSAYPFFELYERSSAVIKKLIEHGDSMLSGRVNFVDLKSFPEYTIREVMTEEGGLFSMREKCLVKMVSTLTGEHYLVSIKKVREITPASHKPVRFI